MFYTKENLKEFVGDMKIQNITGLNDIPHLKVSEIITTNPFGADDDALYYAPGKYITMAQTSDGKVHHHRQVSAQYKVVPYEHTVLCTLESILAHSPEFGVPDIRLRFGTGGGTMYAEYRFNEIEYNVGSSKKPDKIIPMIAIHDCIDLSGLWKSISGAYRLVCSNGMVIAHKDFKPEIHKMMHKNGTYDLSAQIVYMNESLKMISDATSIWKKYAAKKISTLQLADVLEFSGLPHRTQEKVLCTELIGEKTNLLGKIKNGEVNMWQAYNAVTQILTHSGMMVKAEYKYGNDASVAFNNLLDV